LCFELICPDAETMRWRCLSRKSDPVTLAARALVFDPPSVTEGSLLQRDLRPARVEREASVGHGG